MRLTYNPPMTEAQMVAICEAHNPETVSLPWRAVRDFLNDVKADRVYEGQPGYVPRQSKYSASLFINGREVWLLNGHHLAEGEIEVESAA
jgi:hypothetical protein